MGVGSWEFLVSVFDSFSLKPKTKAIQKEARHKLPNLFLNYCLNSPKGNRIPVASVKGRCPRPLDDRAVF